MIHIFLSVLIVMSTLLLQCLRLVTKAVLYWKILPFEINLPLYIKLANTNFYFTK